LTIRRRNLRKALIATGFVLAEVRFPAAMIGGILILVGAALHVWSKGCLEQNRRLTTAGPYRWTRNPFYLANLLIDLGLCLVIGRWWVALPYLAIWAYAYRQTISREEAVLASLFPEAFAEYVKAVPVLIPTGRRLAKERTSGVFSLDNDALAHGREYARLLGIALAPGVIWTGEMLRRVGLSIFDGGHGLELGLVATLLAAWVVKLALAEAFRHPELALLPFASHSEFRRLVLVALVACTFYQAGVLTTWTGHAVAGGVLFVLAVWPGDDSPDSRRAIFDVATGAAVLALGFETGTAWIACLPAAWCVLSWLDRVGASRRTGEGARPLWRAFAPMAAASLAIVVGLEIILRRGV
jgi:hypothetical protein